MHGVYTYLDYIKGNMWVPLGEYPKNKKPKYALGTWCCKFWVFSQRYLYIFHLIVTFLFALFDYPPLTEAALQDGEEDLGLGRGVKA